MYKLDKLTSPNVTPSDMARLATLIRDGLDYARRHDIKEISEIYFKIVKIAEDKHTVIGACAIGMALFGCVNDAERVAQMRLDFFEKTPARSDSVWIGEIIQVPIDLVVHVSGAHYNGVSLTDILGWLDAGDLNIELQII